MSSSPAPLYDLRTTPSAGKSLFAAAPVQPGTLVLSDAPLFTIPQSSRTIEDVQSRVAKLNKDGQRAYFGLSNCKTEGGPVMGIFKTNVLPAGPEESAIFPLASRLNHSCAPNLSFTYHTPSRSLHLYATAPLVPDQELSISYLSTRLLLPAAERQAHLLSSFGFQCVCASCTDQTGESDARRARIAELKTEVDALFPVEPQKAYTASRTLLVLCEEESLAVEAAFARATLAQIVIMWGGAEELAERLVEEVWRAFVCVRGEEGEDARRWARWRGRGQVGKHPRWGGLGRCEFAEEEVKVELKEDR